VRLNPAPTAKRNFDKVKHPLDEFQQPAMHRLDDLDVKIIKELGSPNSLQWNIRESYSNIAKRVGVDEETVRRRLKRAEERGSLPGWKMMVNPHFLKCEAVGLDLEVGDEEKKDRAIAEVRRVDGVIKILAYRRARLAPRADSSTDSNGSISPVAHLSPQSEMAASFQRELL
jgi:hypothetical protein